MFRNKDLLHNSEIIHAMGLASGMILLILGLPAGKILVIVAVLLSCMSYLYRGVSKIDTILEGRFLVVLQRINYFGAAISLLLLLPVVLKLNTARLSVIAVMAICMICLTLNTANRYIYRIPDKDFWRKQVRILVILLFCLAFMMIGKTI